MVSDIEVDDIKNTITLLENLSDTKYFKNSSITFGMIEALDKLLSEVDFLTDRDWDEQKAIDDLLDS